MKAYRVEITQDHPGYRDEYQETIDVLASDAKVALSKALRFARQNGFHPRRRLHVKALTELSHWIA